MRLRWWKSPTVAIGAIVKNEAPHLLEWIAFHRMLGITEFFIADNESTDGTTELLVRLQSQREVRFIDFPDRPEIRPQLSAYRELVKKFGNKADWIAFIDADEFLLPTEDVRNLGQFLKRFDRHVGAIAVNWAIYGSSFRKEAGDGLVVERFTGRASTGFAENHHYKSILRTSAFRAVGPNPHYFHLRPARRLVHCDGQDLVHHPDRGIGLSSRICWAPFRLNHYVVKSREEFEHQKKYKGSATVARPDKGWSYFDHHDRNEESERMPAWLTEATKIELARLKEKIPGYGSDPGRISPAAEMSENKANRRLPRQDNGHEP